MPSSEHQSENLIALVTRQVPTIRPEDSLGRAAELLRSGGAPAIPVLAGNFPVGLITERTLRRALLDMSASGVLDRSVGVMMESDFRRAELYSHRDTALKLLAETDQPALVVTDGIGQYIGILTAADLMSRAFQPIRPRLVGGMATPLGVYLTTGSVSAGVGRVGLALTGALLLCLFVVSDLLLYLFTWTVQAYTPYPLVAWARSPYLNTGTMPDTIGLGLQFAVVPLFLALMRTLPLAGTHAAEHKVVHAIERGERLTLDVVRRMPRVHPRCGTNLAVGGMLFVGLAQSGFMGALGELGLLLTLMITIVFWRPIGNFIQAVATTKPPTDRQLAAAIEVGKELLGNHQRSGVGAVSLGRRLVFSGLPLVMLGWLAAIGLLLIVERFTRISFPLIAG